jgi:hypothetical protein
MRSSAGVGATWLPSPPSTRLVDLTGLVASTL